MAIRVHLEDVLKGRGLAAWVSGRRMGLTEASPPIRSSGKDRGIRCGTINKICYYLGCDVGDILKFDGILEDENES